MSLLIFATTLLAQEKPTLAVLEFDGFGISAPEIAALTNRLRTNMTQLGTYRIVERGLMIEIMKEQDFQLAGCTSDECAVEIGQLLGVQLMLSGSIGKVGNTWTIEMRLVDVETGQAIKSTFYDTQGSIDIVLTEGMGSAARRISGLDAVEISTVTAGPIDAPTPRPAVVSIQTNPVGAVIFVNDIDRGVTPMDAFVIPAGSNQKITARLDRFHPVDTTLSGQSGELLILKLSLKPMNGYIAFDGTEGSLVKIGGRAIGKTPIPNEELQMGTYALAISKPAHYTFRANATVLYDHITTVDYVLKTIPKAPAVVLSTILPGSGQLYHGQKRGLFFLAASVGLAYLGYNEHLILQDNERRYLSYLQEYNNETDIDAALQKRALAQFRFDAMLTAGRQRDLYITSLGGLWTINILDIVF